MDGKSGLVKSPPGSDATSGTFQPKGDKYQYYNVTEVRSQQHEIGVYFRCFSCASDFELILPLFRTISGDGNFLKCHPGKIGNFLIFFVP